MHDDSQISQFFTHWKAAAVTAIGYKQYGLRQWFAEAANQLSLEGYKLDLRKKMLKSGFLTWQNPDLDF